MSVSDNIRTERKKAGLTQKELGERLGISSVGIAQWENGLRTPKIETLMRIADALNVPLSNLLEIHSEEVDEILKETARIKCRARISKIENYLAQLTDEGQEVAVERVRELAEIPRYQDSDGRKAAQERNKELLESSKGSELCSDIEKVYKNYASHGELPDNYVLPWLRENEQQLDAKDSENSEKHDEE